MPNSNFTTHLQLIFSALLFDYVSRILTLKNYFLLHIVTLKNYLFGDTIESVFMMRRILSFRYVGNKEEEG
jgi:hypothetical protein